jgi:hypothetical protein
MEGMDKEAQKEQLKKIVVHYIDGRAEISMFKLASEIKTKLE